MRYFPAVSRPTSPTALLICLPLLLAGIRLAPAQDDLAVLEEQAIKNAVQQIAPSVVRIETIGGLEQVGRMLIGTGPTTGLVVSEDGYVVSSAFNFIQKPSSILVTLPSGKRATAEIVAQDRSRKLVLLKVNTDEKMTVPVAVPRSEMTVGQWAIAVGRTFDGEFPSLSVGVVSAVNRIWGKALQTDVKISPNNYGGPLIDIRGRVLGILVPLSPKGQSEMAGAEWYDSGIGFAAPLSDMLTQLEKMKQGEDLFPGILGIAMKGKDPYANKVEIAAVPPKSPAYEAGLKTGDVIVQANGQPVERQVQLKHIIGRLYAGDPIALVVLRGDERIEATAVLTDKLEPYEHPFLGVLPMRDSGEDAGIVIRYISPESPAAKAGLQPGDVLTELDGQPVGDVAAAQQVLANHEPGAVIGLKYRRADQVQEAEVTLEHLPTELPGELPPSRAAVDTENVERPAVGEVEITILEEENKCFAYVPETYHPNVAHGVLLWLHEPGEVDREATIEQWKDACENNDLILLAPQSADPARWLPTEVDYIRKTLDELISLYNIDPTRIVACGHEAGGAMAFLTAFAHRNLVRGVAVADAVVPARTRVSPNDPIDRLAICMLVAEESKLADRMRQVAKRLQDMKYPVLVEEHPGGNRSWTASERTSLARWIDTLDRL